MTLIVYVSLASVLLSVFDLKKIMGAEDGRKKMIILYVSLMIIGILLLCAFVCIRDFSIAELVIPDF